MSFGVANTALGTGNIEKGNSAAEKPKKPTLFYDPDRFTPQGLEDVTPERFVRTAAAVLNADFPRSDVQRSIVADALNATLSLDIVDEVEGETASLAYDKGIATLIGQAWAAGCGTYEPVRESVTWAETDRLLIDSWVGRSCADDTLTLPAGWSWNRDNYRLIETGTLPPPNLDSSALADCPTVRAYAEKSQGAENPDVWGEYLEEARAGAGCACRFHDSFSTEVWWRAMGGATLLRNKILDWNPHTIYPELLKMFYCYEPLPLYARLAWLLLSQPVVWDSASNTVMQGEHLAVGAQFANTPYLLVYENV